MRLQISIGMPNFGIAEFLFSQLMDKGQTLHEFCYEDQKNHRHWRRDQLDTELTAHARVMGTTAEALGGSAALAPASQRADEIQRVLREAREARERAGQAKWTSNTGLSGGGGLPSAGALGPRKLGEEEVWRQNSQEAAVSRPRAPSAPAGVPTAPSSLPASVQWLAVASPAPKPASTNPTPPPPPAPEKHGLRAVGLDLPKLQHNVSAPSHTGTTGDEAEQRAVREQVLSQEQQVLALQQAAKQAGSSPAASSAEASDTAAAAVQQELISYEPQKRLSCVEEVLDVLEMEEGTCTAPPVFYRSRRDRCGMRPCEDGRASLCP
jgi:hypothetical protein